MDKIARKAEVDARGPASRSGLRRIALAAAIQLVASSRVPALAPPTHGDKEAQAIAAMRMIAAAQAQFKADVDIDTDCDGVGEYGFLAELAGTRPMRVAYQCAPAAGSSSDILIPPLLDASFTRIGRRCLFRDGYLFQMWLPSSTGGSGIVPAIAEDPSGGRAAAPFPDSNNGERLWCCYAWPIRYADTTRRAFFVNQSGQLLQTYGNPFYPFSGFSRMPPFDDAYLIPGDMDCPVRIGTANADGVVWLPVP